MTNTSSIGERLKEERKRLKLTQDLASSMCGVTRETWSRYENGLIAPGSEVITEFAKHNADLAYIFTGIRHENVAKTSQEATALVCFRKLDDNGQLAVTRLLTTLTDVIDNKTDEKYKQLAANDHSNLKVAEPAKPYGEDK